MKARYPTMEKYLDTDPSEGGLIRGNPPGISASLGVLLRDRDLEWMHDQKGHWSLLNQEAEPVLLWSEKAGLRRGLAWRHELESEQWAGKDAKRLLDRCCQELE